MMRRSERARFPMSALILAALAVGCGSGSGEETPGGTTALSPEDATRAAGLFEESACAVCHGDLGEGVDGVGPALQQLGPYWSAERLSTYLEDPQAFRAANPDFESRRDIEYELEMPAFAELSSEERVLLGRWLMAR